MARMTPIFLLLLSMAVGAPALTCVDEDGTEVDWLIMYKLPREAGRKHKTGSIISDGKVGCTLLTGFLLHCIS
jgi:hypothetical protein